ncbi:porin [Psychrobacter sp. P2G3]|uniref:porin n=1 Tax=Psychrobacter sp. P2G3 TaxID=1699622 RepID=UPI00078C6EF0|nr:porin [Psychrobacter sp. P2G3]AMN50123.1 porin [Psychrobacter sp. P2G3]
MKKLLLATAVAALSVSAANAAPTLYGKAFVTADYVDVERDGAGTDNDVNNDSVQVNSNISRLGFKGSEAMTANTDVIYQLEYGINIDDSGSDNIGFRSRDTYLGLDNKNYGQFRFGRNYSVTDYINNVTVTEGFWDNLGVSNLDMDGSVLDAVTMADGGRVNNSIVWKAPKYNNLPLELALQYGADESFVSDNDDRNSGFGASLMFDQGAGFTAGIAYEKDMSLSSTRNVVNADGNPIIIGGTTVVDAITDEEVLIGGENLTRTSGGELIRGSATVDLGKYMAAPVTLGAMYQVADFDFAGSEKEKGLVVSAEMGLTNFARPAAVYLQYNGTKNLAGIDNRDSDQVVLGGKYMYKDNMIAHAYVGNNSAEDNDSSTDLDVFAIGGGLEYKF